MVLKNIFFTARETRDDDEVRGGRVLRSKKTLQLEHTMQYEKDYKNAPKGTPELWNFLTVSTEQRGNSLFIGKYVINTFR